MCSDEIENTLGCLGFVGYAPYECKARKGEYWAYFFEDNELKNGYPNGLVIRKGDEDVFRGIIPDTEEELLVLLKLLSII